MKPKIVYANILGRTMRCEVIENKTMKTFETWTHAGVKYLAFPFAGNFTVIDENGGNFGGWVTVGDFRKAQADKNALCQPLGGIVTLSRKLEIVPMCSECGKYPADPPSTTCPSCDAYKEHTAI